MYNCFDTVAAAHGQTDRNPISISRAGMNVKILSSSKLSIVNIIRTLRNGSVCSYVGWKAAILTQTVSLCGLNIVADSNKKVSYAQADRARRVNIRGRPRKKFPHIYSHHAQFGCCFSYCVSERASRV